MKWFETIGIVEKESATTRQKAETLVDTFLKRKEERRAWASKELLARQYEVGKMRGEQLQAIFQDNAARECQAAGIDPSASNIQRQIRSGHTWANTIQQQADAEVEAERQKELADIRADLLKMKQITYDSDPAYVDNLVQIALINRRKEQAFLNGDYEAVKHWQGTLDVLTGAKVNASSLPPEVSPEVPPASQNITPQIAQTEWGRKNMEILDKVMEYGLYPVTAMGMLIWNSLKGTPSVNVATKTTQPITPEIAAQALGASAAVEVKSILPGGEVYQQYQSLPMGEKLLYEAPAWALLGVLGVSATAGTAKLAPTAAQGGAKGAAATAGQVALAPAVAYESAISGILRLFPKVTAYTAEAIAKRNFAASEGGQRIINLWGKESPQYQALYKIWRLNQRTPPKGQSATFYQEQAKKEFDYWYNSDKAFREGVDDIVGKPKTTPTEPTKPSTLQLAEPKPVPSKATPKVTLESVKPTAVAEKVTAKPTAKEPWQMTQGEYVSARSSDIMPLGMKDTPANRKLYLAQKHQGEIRQALSEGKPVPAEVLKDYPDLKGGLGTAKGQITLKVLRGVSQGKTDAGDFGKGTYYTGDYERARAYGEVTEHTVTLKNPKIFNSYSDAMDYRKSIVGEALVYKPQSEEASLMMEKALRAEGYDGVVIYDKEAKYTAYPDKPFEVVKLRDGKPTAEVPTTPAGMPEVPKANMGTTNWQKAQVEASERIEAIENEWVAKNHVGVNKEQQVRIDAIIVEVAKKYRVPPTVLRKNVLWEAQVTPEQRVPATEAEQAELLSGVNLKSPPSRIIPQERWDSAKLGVKVELAKAGGWVSKKGQLTKLGEKIANSKWEDLSLASQNVLQRLIRERYMLETTALAGETGTPTEWGTTTGEVSISGGETYGMAGDTGTINLPPPVTPSPIAENVIGLRTIEPGLIRSETIGNLFKGLVSRVGFRPVKAEPMASAAMRERARVKVSIESNANVIGTKAMYMLPKVFVFDKMGRIPSLDGIDSTIKGAPTIQDVAARLPTYQGSLSEAQLKVLDELRQMIEPYKNLLDEVGVDIPVPREDVMEDGFYLPRGRAALEGADEPLKVSGGGRGVKKGFEKPALFDSMAEGINKGFKYSSIEDSLTAYAYDAGTRAIDAHIVNYFKALTDDTGKLIGETAKMRLLRQNPELAKKVDDLKYELAKLRRNIGALTDRQLEVIDLWENDPDFTDIDVLLGGLQTMKGGKARVTLPELKTIHQQILDDLQALKPAYQKALRRAQAVPREQGVISLPSLQGWTWPDEVANAANVVLNKEGKTIGYLSPAINTINTFNNLYRGVRATLDNSALGIQGLLGAYGDPKAYLQAFKVNLLAWGNGGDKILGKFMTEFDVNAKTKGLMTTTDWSQDGLHLGGTTSEFQIGAEGGQLGEKISRLPVVRHANRAFGYFGDAIRLELAQNELQHALSKTKLSIDELRETGKTKEMAKGANGMTGWAATKFAGSLGDLVMFAPRFFQSRLETIARGAMGLRPDATYEQRMSRNALLKMIGFGVVLTVIGNTLAGEEDTDFRPIVNGRRNPKFMRIKFNGRYYSLFGTWESLLGMFTNTITGHPQLAMRSTASGAVSMAWDLITGKDYNYQAVMDSPGSFAKWIGNSMIPFSAGQLPEGFREFGGGIMTNNAKGTAGGLMAIVSQVIGIKSWKDENGNPTQSALNKVAQYLYGKNFDELTPIQKKTITGK